MLHFVSEATRNQFLREQNLIYYKIHGGLGNQFFGLSAAHQLYKDFDKRIAIDVTNLDHTPELGPEWSNWSEIREWCEIFTQAIDIPLPNETWNLIRPFTSMNESKNFFTGWRLSLEDVYRSGLFKEGSFPHAHPKERNSGIAIHIRGGDYRNATGIGLLHSSYYKRAINALADDSGSPVTIFTDDPDYARSIEDDLRLITQAEYSQTSSALEVMAEMSAHGTFIGSNSTLSWWSAFFSQGNNVFMPQPMYLQDWKADKEILLDKVEYLGRFPNKLNESLNYLIWNVLRA
jgi:hypothetical protein